MMPKALSLAAACGAALLVALTVEASAQPGRSSVAFSCNQIRAIVNAEGAALFYWPTRPRERWNFGRFVSYGQRYCDPHETAETAFIPAADTATCPVLECRHKPSEFRHRN